MNKKKRLLVCVVLTAVLVSGVASAQFVTNTVENTQSVGVNYNFGTLASTLDRNGGSDFAT